MLKFNSNGSFRIMQITDIQEVPNISPDTLTLLEKAMAAEKPDLVVLTGDQIKGYGVSYKGNKTSREDAVEAVIQRLLTPITSRGIPFTATFGNHDRQVGVSNENQLQHIYMPLPAFQCGESVGPDAGTLNLPIYSSDGAKRLFNLYLFDSGTDKKGGGYEPFSKDTISWYRETREKLCAENQAKYLPSLVFQHIPPCEVYDVLKKTDKHEKGAVRAYRTHKNEYYVPGTACREGAALLEPPSVPDENTGEFDALKEKGDICGIYFGHDHKNSFVGMKDGIELGYTQSAGFSEYGNGAQRGVRIFDLNERAPADYETYTVTFRELCGSKLHKPFRDFLLRHAPATVDAAIPMIVKGLFGIAAIVTLLILLFNKLI